MLRICHVLSISNDNSYHISHHSLQCRRNWSFWQVGLPAYFIEYWRLGVLGLKKRLGLKHKIEEKIVGFPIKIEEKILSLLMEFQEKITLSVVE